MTDSVKAIKLELFKLNKWSKTSKTNNSNLFKVRRKLSKRKDFPTTHQHSLLLNTVATLQEENPTSLSAEQLEEKFVLYN